MSTKTSSESTVSSTVALTPAVTRVVSRGRAVRRPMLGAVLWTVGVVITASFLLCVATER